MARLTKRFKNAQMQEDVELLTTVRDGVFRLAEYEDAEEEGLLLRLPCRPGDIVYVVGTKCLSGLYDIECDMYDPETDCPCHLENELVVFKKETDLRFLAELIMKKNPNFILGDTVFTNSDDAFERLAEITKQNSEVG